MDCPPPKAAYMRFFLMIESSQELLKQQDKKHSNADSRYPGVVPAGED